MNNSEKNDSIPSVNDNGPSVPIKIFLLCPIPENQKPINEYIQSKKSSFLSALRNFVSKNYVIQSIISLICTFIVKLVVKQHLVFGLSLWQYLRPLVLVPLISCIIFLLSFLLFLHWKEIQNRFFEARIFYEEGSWYDGQIWEKPFLLIKNDRLLATQKIHPILQKISKTFLFTSLSFLTWLLILSF